MADLSQFLNGGAGGSAGKKVVSVVASNIPASPISVTPSASQYGAIVIEVQNGFGASNLTVTSGATTLYNANFDDIAEEITSTTRGITPAFFIGGKGETVTATYIESGIRIDAMVLLYEDL